MNTSLASRLLPTARPVAVRSAAPTWSRKLLVAVFASRGKSFVLRKYVFGLRLLTELAPADVQTRYGDVVDHGDEDVAVDDNGNAGKPIPRG